MQFSHPGRGGGGGGAQGLRRRGVRTLRDTTRPRKGIFARQVIPGPCPCGGVSVSVNLASNGLQPHRVGVICAWAGRRQSACRSLPSLSSLHRRPHVIPGVTDGRQALPFSRANAIANISNISKRIAMQVDYDGSNGRCLF